jgi:hypothetical protein
MLRRISTLRKLYQTGLLIDAIVFCNEKKGRYKQYPRMIMKRILRILCNSLFDHPVYSEINGSVEIANANPAANRKTGAVNPRTYVHVVKNQVLRIAGESNASSV